MNNRNFLGELKNFYIGIKDEDLKRLYNLDFHLVRYADDVIANNRCVNRSSLSKKRELSDIQKIDGFTALFLCGGMATGFANVPKAIYEIKNLPNFKCQISFLGLNILQIIKAEKLFCHKIPIIIYDDFYTHDKIVTHLKKNSFFGKNPIDFYYVRESAGLRYVPNEKFLLANGFKNNLSPCELNGLSRETRLFVVGSVKNSIISDGHFVLNNLILSKSFRLLIKDNPRIKYLVVSNVDNLGQKYFPNLVNTDSSQNYILVCKRTAGERMDNIFNASKGLIIEPYFVQNRIESKIGFTATSYIKLDNLFAAFGYKSEQRYLTASKSKKLPNKYRLVLKTPVIDGIKMITVHFESSLAEIWRFLKLEAVEVDRDRAFYPFKSLNDITPDYIKSLSEAIIKYNYI